MTRTSLAAVILGALVLTPLNAGAGDKSSRLDDRQRSQILALIKVVDSAQVGATPLAEPTAPWTLHVLKSTTGMNYVPMTMALDLPGVAEGEVGVYVRVVPRVAPSHVSKSALEHWLITEAMKTAPRPAPFRGFVSVNPEEMPVGFSASSRRQAVSASGASTAVLALYERQQMRAENERRAAERAAKADEADPEAAAKRREAAEAFLYPFEDFGFSAPQAAGPKRALRVDRALALPPGEYDLYVAASGGGNGADSVVYRTSVSVPSYDGDELMLSSIILADRLETLTTPYSAEQQASHPYALGWTQIVPAVDREFTDQEQIALVFQVLNPVSDVRHKPDVTVEYAFHLQQSAGEPVSVTARQDFNSRTLPAEFDVDKGHQVFAAQAVPLTTFQPGTYRLDVKVTDNVAGRSVSRDLEVRVRATNESLWLRKTVEGLLSPAFSRSQVLSSAAVSAALDELVAFESVPAALSAPMTDARAGRYATVLGAVPAGTDVASSFLRGIAMMALGENLEVAANQFREALRAGSDFMPATLYLGACYAANGRDREAMAAWQLVTLGDSPTPIAHELLADGWLRARDAAKALDVLGDAAERWPAEPGVGRRLAAAHILAGRRVEGLAALDAYLTHRPDDVDALFLASYLLHAARAGGADPVPADREKLAGYASAYAAAKGPYQAMMEQWGEED